MNFLEKLISLQEKYTNDIEIQKNGTKLVGLSRQAPPLARHYIYAPMQPGVRSHLIESYRRNFPEELLCVYEVANGFNLFWTYLELGPRRIKIPRAQLSVYGVPNGTSTERSLEPFNISIEDLGRPNGIPDNWLKFGSYQIISNLREWSAEYALFVDVDNGTVYAVDRNEKTCRIEQSWASIDACLCELFDMLEK